MRCRQGRRYGGAVERQCLPITYRLGQRRVSGTTTYADVGASVLVLTSCSAELGLELRSVYLAGERRGKVLVAASGLLGTEPAQLFSRLIADPGEALVYERRRLLYDHLQALQDLAVRGGLELAVDGVDAAVAALDAGPAAPTVS